MTSENMCRVKKNFQTKTLLHLKQCEKTYFLSTQKDSKYKNGNLY